MHYNITLYLIPFYFCIYKLINETTVYVIIIIIILINFLLLLLLLLLSINNKLNFLISYSNLYLMNRLYGVIINLLLSLYYVTRYN